MKWQPFSLLAALAIGGCTAENNQPIYDALWSTELVSGVDGVYVRLPHAGKLIRLEDSGAVAQVDLNGADPTRLVSVPDGSKTLAFAQWLECEDEDESIIYLSDCNNDDLKTHTELHIVDDGQTTGQLDIPSFINTLSFPGSGDLANVAVAYLDDSQMSGIEINGVVDLGAVYFIDMDQGQIVGSTSVGFSPDRILFGQDNKAIIMSRSKVVVVDLNTYQQAFEAPLTLDADQNIDPSGAELAYDIDSQSEILLLTVENSADLYMLNLKDEFWNIGDLGAVPTGIGVDSDTGKSVFVFGSSSKAIVLNNSELSTLNSSSIQTIDLEEPSNKTLVANKSAVLYNDANDYVHDVYRIDLETSELTEYVAENPISSLRLNADGSKAVAVMKPEFGSGSYQDANWGVAILDLGSDDIVNLVAESRPVGVEIIDSEDSSYALVLLSGLDYVLKLDLANPRSAEQIDLPAAPLSLGTMPDGRFLIAHDSQLGMVSTFDPAVASESALTTHSGFAAVGLLNNDKLPRRGEEN